MKFINDISFDIRLIIMQLGFWKTLFQFFQKIFKVAAAVNIFFTHTKQIQVRAIDDLYFHCLPDKERELSNFGYKYNKILRSLMSNWDVHIKGFTHYLKLERSLSSNSVEAYERDAIKLKQFMEMTYPKVSPLATTFKQLQGFLQYVNELGMSAYSQARILSGVKGFYKYLMFEELIEKDPTELIEGPKIGRKLPDTLSYPEIEKLLEAIDLSKPEGGRNRAMLEVLYSSGLRVSELVELKLNNIYFDVGFLRVIGKGNKERLVPIGRDALKYLKIYIQEIRVHVPVQKGSEADVFLNKRGKRLSRVTVFTVIKELAQRIGLKKTISPHTFRHSFATHLIEGGADLRAVQEMLGHESITTTEIYTHLDRDYLRQVITEFHPRS